jgi:hypothetical protein
LNGENKEIEKKGLGTQKVEIELDLAIVRLLELIGKMISWTPEILIKEIISNEIRYIKQNFEEGSYEFLESYLDNSEIRKEIDKLLRVI